MPTVRRKQRPRSKESLSRAQSRGRSRGSSRTASRNSNKSLFPIRRKSPSRSPSRSPERSTSHVKKSAIPKNTLVVWSEKQPTAKAEHLFLDEAPTVQIVVYRHNKLNRLSSSLGHCRHLKLLDLSHNGIIHLPEEKVWLNLVNLQYLNLSHNKIHTWESIVALKGCPVLSVLVLLNNPVTYHENYRHFVVNQLHRLDALDCQVVVDSEVIDGLSQPPALLQKYQEQKQQQETLMNKFPQNPPPPHTSELTLQQPTPQSAPQTPQSTTQSLQTGQKNHESLAKDLQERHNQLGRNNVRVSRFVCGSSDTLITDIQISSQDTAEYSLAKLNRFIRTASIRRSRCSALVCIQAFARRLIVKKNILRDYIYGPPAATMIQSAVRGYFTRNSVEGELEKLLMSSESGVQLMVTTEEQERERAAQLIQIAYRASKLYTSIGSTKKKSRRKENERSVVVLEEEEDPDRMDMKQFKNDFHSLVSGDRGSFLVEEDEKNIKQAEVWNDQELSTYDMGKFSKELRRIGNGYDSFQEDIDLWDDSRPSTALPSITVTHRQQLSKTKQRRRIIQIQKPEEDGEECNDEELTCIEMRITGKTAAAIRPYTALDDSKYQMSENIRATRAESQRISALRQKRLAESTAEKRQHIRFLREIIPAQRKLAKLCRPDANVQTIMSKDMKQFLRQKAKEELEKEILERKKRVHERNRIEKESLLRRQETKRSQHLATFQRPFTAKEIEKANMPPKEDLNSTDVLIRDVRRRKRRVKSAKRKREKSQKHAKMFSRANNSTSRHIARGNLIRRKNQAQLDIQRRVARTRALTMQRQAVMREAVLRKQNQEQIKIENAKEEYKQMLIWRRNVDIQKLEMARLRKEYHKDLRELVQKVQRGELNQPIWDLHQERREFLERQEVKQHMIPVRPKSRGPSGRRFGAFNNKNDGRKGGGPETLAADLPFEENIISEMSTTFSMGPTMERTIDLKGN